MAISGNSTAQVSEQVSETTCWSILQYQYASLQLCIKHSTDILIN